MENAASEDARPRATESIVSGVSGKFFKLFRNFGPAVPGEGDARWTKNPDKISPRARNCGPFSNHNPNNQKQINKINKQNNHNARGANRRERRTKLNSRARAGQRARTDNPLAKRPAVQILTISNVPSDILEAIDELAARQDRSRSSFVRRELQRIVADYQAKAALASRSARNRNAA